jgi:uncharacterized protein
MIIRVSELDAEGRVVDDVAAVPAPFTDPSWRLDRVDLTVRPDGPEVDVTGRLTASVPLACGRCLEALPTTVDVDVAVRVVPRPADGDARELGADDLDVDFYVGDLLDLAKLIETETTLALPMKPLCREDCRGLCPRCGANRNAVACGCEERPPDPRLAVLRGLSTRLHD